MSYQSQRTGREIETAINNSYLANQSIKVNLTIQNDSLSSPDMSPSEFVNLISNTPHIQFIINNRSSSYPTITDEGGLIKSVEFIYGLDLYTFYLLSNLPESATWDFFTLASKRLIGVNFDLSDPRSTSSSSPFSNFKQLIQYSINTNKEGYLLGKGTSSIANVFLISYLESDNTTYRVEYDYRGTRYKLGFTNNTNSWGDITVDKYPLFYTTPMSLDSLESSVRSKFQKLITDYLSYPNEEYISNSNMNSTPILGTTQLNYQDLGKLFARFYNSKGRLFNDFGYSLRVIGSDGDQYSDYGHLILQDTISNYYLILLAGKKKVSNSFTDPYAILKVTRELDKWITPDDEFSPLRDISYPYFNFFILSYCNYWSRINTISNAFDGYAVSNIIRKEESRIQLELFNQYGSFDSTSIGYTLLGYSYVSINCTRTNYVDGQHTL